MIARGWPTTNLERLYAGWADTGFGLLVAATSSSMGITSSGRATSSSIASRTPINSMPCAPGCGSRGRAVRTWAQLSHSGRQTQKAVNPHPVSPSAIRVGLPGGLFGNPREMLEIEIETLIAQFAAVARVCRERWASPASRSPCGTRLPHLKFPPARRPIAGPALDGATTETRPAPSCAGDRCLDRESVGRAFPISVKLNSADFQKGGFGTEESEQVARMLEAAGVDLLEISGGSYEVRRW